MPEQQQQQVEKDQNVDKVVLKDGDDGKKDGQNQNQQNKQENQQENPWNNNNNNNQNNQNYNNQNQNQQQNQWNNNNNNQNQNNQWDNNNKNQNNQWGNNQNQQQQQWGNQNQNQNNQWGNNNQNQNQQQWGNNNQNFDEWGQVKESVKNIASVETHDEDQLEGSSVKSVKKDTKEKKENTTKKGERTTKHNFTDKENTKHIMDKLKLIYKHKIKPLEQKYKFDKFNSPCLTDTDIEAKPMVLLLGQYSTGKTSFIKFLVESEFPGLRIGPEPTTDRFVAVMHGKERTIPGHALAIQEDKPFRALQKFGMDFLGKFECAQLPAPILKKLTFIDTPGVLAGEKQRMGRSYNFPEVIKWFAERVDRILLLFDAHKLDISDEFKQSIYALRGHDDKIRVVLNKADLVDAQQLMRVYGALMWSLGKVVQTPEVLRVFIGSFWDKPYKNKENIELFEKEQKDLIADLKSVPKNSLVRKINELVKRARMAKVHACLIAHLRQQFGWFGKTKTKEKILNNLLDEYRKVQRMHNFSVGDFPDIKEFRKKLEVYDVHKFPKYDEKLVQRMDQVLEKDIPALLKKLPSNIIKKEEKVDLANPFATSKGTVTATWMVTTDLKMRYCNMFYKYARAGGKMSSQVAVNVLGQSGLQRQQLAKIWSLSDIDKDGSLDEDEWCVANYLIDGVRSGKSLPSTLPQTLVPPSKRDLKN